MSKRSGIQRKTGRPRKLPPAGAANTIRELASLGHSIVGIAERFNVCDDVLSRWMDEMPELREALNQGREKERHTLHNTLYVQATECGNATAAMFLLKSRHGYREGDQGETANRVSINFTLPGALPLETFIEGSTEVLPKPDGFPALPIKRK
ncbi:MAG: hypothetical protein Q8L97_10200 [Nitrosomonas sp.]|uniref:hypothetical protein n=1 Tax=Nitrosomonas sp. TaxID=42353 RepID=UPI00272F0C2F|nr:hypothetical protein [Nitrosomonas sp.]MDP1550514.1 hypothetical protein [Nitrosomonas sp.]